MSTDFKPGDWVEVKPEHDIPPMFRPDGKPTSGRIDSIAEDGSIWVWVPIGGADVDEHSQAMPYEAHQLVKPELACPAAHDSEEDSR
jgi:hypothetical protein